VLTASGVFKFRIIGGCAACLGGLVALAAHDDPSLGVAGLVLAVFIFGHLTIENRYQELLNQFQPSTQSDPDGVATSGGDGQPVEGLRDFASAFVSTSGVILGLLAVFSDGDLSVTTKVGIGALVTDILVGTVLVGLVISAPDSADQRSWNFIRYVFNFALWALALGLLCIATALLYS
jgi:hypothetical protein